MTAIVTTKESGVIQVLLETLENRIAAVAAAYVEDRSPTSGRH